MSSDLDDEFVSALKPYPLRAGAMIHDAGDPVSFVVFPEDGLVSIVTPMREGRDIENTSRGRDGALGYLEASGSGVFVSRAVVQIPGAAYRLPASAWVQTLDRSSHLRRVVARRTELLIADARLRGACRVAHEATPRLARILLETSERVESDTFSLTQTFLGDMIGVGRTTVVQAMGILTRQGLIQHRRGAVNLVDRPGLKQVACECYTERSRMRLAILGH